MPFIGRLEGCRSGNAAIEFALVAPVFLLMFLGAIEFGRLLWTQSTLQQATEAAARCASFNSSQCTDSSSVQSYAAAQMYGLSVDSSVFTYTASPNGNCGGNEVTASLTFSFVAPKLLPFGPITLTAQSCYPAES